MIGRITGILVEKQAPALLVDVKGVGYELQVSMNTYFGLPAPGETVSLHTHFVVREDAQILFGFATQEERALFRTLIRVSGVGPKMALAILSGMSADEFIRCIAGGEVATLVRLPGVGKKTAERLLVEMKDRLSGWVMTSHSVESPSTTASSDSQAEAESALVALGYKNQEAARMVAAAKKTLGDDAGGSEALIRAALKSMVKA